MFGRSKSLVLLAASLTLAAVLSSPAFASSLCSDDRATRAVREIVQTRFPNGQLTLRPILEIGHELSGSKI